MKLKKITGLLVTICMIIGLASWGIFSDGMEYSTATAETAETVEESVEVETEETNATEENQESAPSMPDDAIIASGVFIGEFDMGGKTKQEAAQMLQEYITGLANKEIVLSISGNRESIYATDLGFQWENTNVVDEVASLGTKGNLIARYKTLKDIETTNYKIGLTLNYDEAAVGAFVENSSAKYDVPVKNAGLTRSGGRFVVSPSNVGAQTNREQTNANLLEAMRTDATADQLVVEATVEEQQPTRTAEQLSQVKDVLGTYSTGFNAGNAGRSKNLTTGSGKINGVVLMPGEEFSGYGVMAPFTMSNGYANAGTYSNGQVIESVGGGACQIATTIYNTALLAEVEVTQRQNHSMIVSYVPYSFDAAIAGTYKDIKFKNNYDAPIYLECTATSGRLVFTIYGKDTRPANRTFKYQSVTINESPAGAAIETVDNSLAPGTQIIEQSAYPAVSSQLWKYVYVDGQQTEKNLIHSDRYSSSPARVRVGPPAGEVSVVPEDLGDPGDPGAPPEENQEPEEPGPGAE